MSNPDEIIKQSLIFSGLTQDELKELTRLATARNFTPGEFIFMEGDPPDWFYLVAEGQVKIGKYTAEGKEFIIAFFGPGEIVGEVAVFENKPYPASAQAVTATSVLVIKRQDLVSFVGQLPEVALRIIGVLGARLRDAQSRLKELAAERVEQRIATTLLRLSAKLGTTLPFTRQEIADMAGTTTETAIRIMSQLTKRGIIKSARGKVIITDELKLRLLSEGPPRV